MEASEETTRSILVHANGPLLLGVTPFNPLTFIGAAFLLTLGALAAAFFPARRATRVDPIRSLHDE